MRSGPRQRGSAYGSASPNPLRLTTRSSLSHLTNTRISAESACDWRADRQAGQNRPFRQEPTGWTWAVKVYIRKSLQVGQSLTVRACWLECAVLVIAHQRRVVDETTAQLARNDSLPRQLWSPYYDTISDESCHFVWLRAVDHKHS